MHAGFGWGRPETGAAQVAHGAGRPSNHEWDARALLSLVLVGLPDTRDRLALHKNRSLWSRIHTRICLGEASPADTAEYIAYR